MPTRNFLNGGHENTCQKLRIYQTNMFCTWLDAELLLISEKKFSKHENVLKAFFRGVWHLDKEIVAREIFMLIKGT